MFWKWHKFLIAKQLQNHLFVFEQSYRKFSIGIIISFEKLKTQLLIKLHALFWILNTYCNMVKSKHFSSPFTKCILFFQNLWKSLQGPCPHFPLSKSCLSHPHIDCVTKSSLAKFSYLAQV